MSEVVVVDNGSGTIKAGLAGEDQPKLVFPTVVGKPKSGVIGSSHTYVGEEALRRRGLLRLEFPIKNTIIDNLENMENIWRYMFEDRLKVSPENHPVFLTIPPIVPELIKQRIAECMFEKFQVPSLYLGNTAVMSLYNSGVTDGLVVESGHEGSFAVPVSDGLAIDHAVIKLPLAGSDLTENLLKIFYENNGSQINATKDIFQRIKEKLGYVALDYDQEMKATSSVEQNYELPDGTVFTLGKERFRCTESLFSPSLIGKEDDGIHKIAHDSIMKCDESMRSNMYEKIVLSGGSTMFSGFAARMQKEISNLAPSSTKVIISGPPDRIYSPWIGGNIFSSLPSAKKMFVTSEDYYDIGPSTIAKM